MWEVPLLALISEIVQRDRHPQVTQEDAVTQLKKLLTVFYDQAAENHIDLSRFKLMDFGTRRRFPMMSNLLSSPCLKRSSLTLWAQVITNWHIN